MSFKHTNILEQAKLRKKQRTKELEDRQKKAELENKRVREIELKQIKQKLIEFACSFLNTSEGNILDELELEFDLCDRNTFPLGVKIWDSMWSFAYSSKGDNQICLSASIGKYLLILSKCKSTIRAFTLDSYAEQRNREPSYYLDIKIIPAVNLEDLPTENFLYLCEKTRKYRIYKATRKRKSDLLPVYELILKKNSKTSILSFSIKPMSNLSHAKFTLPQPVLISEQSQSPSKVSSFPEVRITEFFRSRELSNNTKRSYNRAFKRFLGWSDKSWHEISDRDLNRYKQYLKDLNLKPSSICQELSALKSIFKWLHAKRYIDRNPTSILELPTISPVIEDKSLDPKLIESLKIQLKEDERDFALFQVLLHGLRREEICNLTVEDYQGDCLLVRDAKHGSDRVVPLLDTAIAALDRYILHRGEPKDCKALFLSRITSKEVSGLTSDGLYYLCTSWGFNPHQARHTLCQYLIDNGMDSLLAMQITGHKSANSFKRYSQKALQKQAAKQFRNLHQ